MVIIKLTLFRDTFFFIIVGKLEAIIIWNYLLLCFLLLLLLLLLLLCLARPPQFEHTTSHDTLSTVMHYLPCYSRDNCIGLESSMWSVCGIPTLGSVFGAIIVKLILNRCKFLIKERLFPIFALQRQLLEEMVWKYFLSVTVNLN